MPVANVYFDSADASLIDYGMEGMYIQINGSFISYSLAVVLDCERERRTE